MPNYMIAQSGGLEEAMAAATLEQGASCRGSRKNILSECMRPNSDTIFNSPRGVVLGNKGRAMVTLPWKVSITLGLLPKRRDDRMRACLKFRFSKLKVGWKNFPC